MAQLNSFPASAASAMYSTTSLEFIFEVEPSGNGNTYRFCTNMVDDTAQGYIWVPNNGSSSIGIALPRVLNQILTATDQAEASKAQAIVLLTVIPSPCGNVVRISAGPPFKGPFKDFFVPYGFKKAGKVLLPFMSANLPNINDDCLYPEINADVDKNVGGNPQEFETDPSLVENSLDACLKSYFNTPVSKNPVQEDGTPVAEKASCSNASSWLKSPFRGRLLERCNVPDDKAEAAFTLQKGISRSMTPSRRSRASSVVGWDITAEDDFSEAPSHKSSTPTAPNHLSGVLAGEGVHGIVNPTGTYSLVNSYGYPLHLARHQSAIDDINVHGAVNADGTFSLINEHPETLASPDATVEDEGQVHGIVNADGSYSLVRDDHHGNHTRVTGYGDEVDEDHIHGAINSDGTYSIVYDPEPRNNQLRAKLPEASKEIWKASYNGDICATVDPDAMLHNIAKSQAVFQSQLPMHNRDFNSYEPQSVELPRPSGSFLAAETNRPSIIGKMTVDELVSRMNGDRPLVIALAMFLSKLETESHARNSNNHF